MRGRINYIDFLRKKLEDELDRKISLDGKSILIYGAGNTALLNRTCFEPEKLDVKAFVYRRFIQKKEEFLGKPGITPDEICNYPNPVVLICSAIAKTSNSIAAYLDSKGIENYRLDEYIFSYNFDKILKVFDSLCNDESKKLYAEIVISRMNGKEIDQNLICQDEYFSDTHFLKRDQKEVFVDCGAYVGDTIEQYIYKKAGIFNQIYAFEPNEKNYKALEFRAERLKKEWALEDNKIILVKAGVSDSTYKTELHFAEAEGPHLSSSLDDGKDSSGNIDVVNLDDFFKDKFVSFIKADIESFEPKMIKGAENLIRNCKPLIAICIYHNAYDLFEIPLMLKELNENYQFFVKQHYDDYTDTVLYAYNLCNE